MWTLDFDALQEDLRKLGLGLILAGLAGLIIDHPQVTTLNGFLAIFIGLSFIFAGVIRKSGVT